jgi:hypothetical protein
VVESAVVRPVLKPKSRAVNWADNRQDEKIPWEKFI